MGCDIHGWIEIRPWTNHMKTRDEYWVSVVDIEYIVSRNYDMFGLLFGVRNYGNFKPIAQERGMPSYEKHQFEKEMGFDSEEWFDYRPYAIRQNEDMGPDGHSHSWISLKEIEGIDWDSETDTYDERVHIYIKKNGKFDEWGKAGFVGTLSDEDLNMLGQKKKVYKGDFMYCYEKVKFKDVLSGDWNCVFNIMRELGKIHGVENVRLTVWFDN